MLWFVLYNIPGPHSLNLALSDMSSFIPGHFGDHPPPLGEEPSRPESPQNPGQTNIVISHVLQVVNIILATLYFFVTLLFQFETDPVPDPVDDTLQALAEESSHPEQPQDSGETHTTGVPQVVVTGK
ncbi:hypothetical protein P692DRAFT_20886747 [Suillus brevipes Sb2]|nr:hypothetical protein P692DRAFT_20886747 [Suillus brevipes Sb2]